jgi:penicillin-binding protein 1A
MIPDGPDRPAPRSTGMEEQPSAQPETEPVPEETSNERLAAIRDWLKGRWLKYLGIAFAALFTVAIAWACWKAPPWRGLQPPEEPSITLTTAEGTPFARAGQVRDAPVDAAKLPLQVRGAFIAIEDRRFRVHHGVDLRGLLRAFWHNARAGGVVEGGSTITQQLVKNAYLTHERSMARKAQEAVLALWLDAWLSKDEILSRYLSTVYFGDGVYGLTAAARHYFGKAPEQLEVAEAAMLAGVIKAPSRLNPVANMDAAQARARIVLGTMVREKMIAPEAAAALAPARLRLTRTGLPTGTYFADWIGPEVEKATADSRGQVEIRTTLEAETQKAAVEALTSILARYGGKVHATQAALVAMRTDGRVVAMVGGRSYAKSPFNRATQAKRQSGSAFKPLVYLTALENGWRPESALDDSPVKVGDWAPRNSDGQYRGQIPLRDAFALSSNVATVRLAEAVGRPQIAATARRLGIATPLSTAPSMALGTSGLSLIELTAAYAAIASGQTPVRPHGLPTSAQTAATTVTPINGTARDAMLDLLWTAANYGTGHSAALANRDTTPSFGKTGTTQDYRDALFIGFAGDLITGVWVGNDDNSPMRRVTGGSLPAQIWHAFMEKAKLGPGPSFQVPAYRPLSGYGEEDMEEVPLLPFDPSRPWEVYPAGPEDQEYSPEQRYDRPRWNPGDPEPDERGYDREDRRADERYWRERERDRRLWLEDRQRRERERAEEEGWDEER